ncbi:probable receptor-like serine/threonine-protein kinase At5g57670 isoform X2 [Mercurialis annua]|uniref:probable receptor-like serine/threonine-protein kinase At5g57670 isoform X2 n=1 Tax=Mercurialis annua TaxID=3986 RepID=UPI00215EA373|nr:probable receptor-like serine/threonine-protein kinase At5g57670 isoform X2 [Mercurialis annua]
MKMISSSSSTKILIGISDDSTELLSWAITVLAHPNDNIAALHVLVGDETNKKKKKRSESIKKEQWRIRQAKAHVISVLGEFARTCMSLQINLEARVGFSSSVAKGLIEEAKSISADYLILGRSNKTWHEVAKYCYKHAPQGCTVVSIGKCEQPPQNSIPTSVKETPESNSRWLCNANYNSGSTESIGNDTESETKSQNNSSPKTVLDEVDVESNTTEDDSISIEGSTITESPPLPPKKQNSARKIFSSFFTSPLRKRNYSFSNKEKTPPRLICFSYQQIANATNNFHTRNIVGRGGYSEVYRGDLSDGTTIAVKRLAKDNKDATKEKEFLTELGIIGHVSHPNTANLVGCCIENGLYLIFDFSQNGNLESALHGNLSESLDWEVRFRIILGVAKGLHYLHKCCSHRIIHRDIKASNVLLGPDFEPQITDFGLAKWLPNKWSHHAVIPIEGTFGYLAPEYFMHGIVDEKTDVFSFGILLLEIISGRRPVDHYSKQNLLLWAKPLMESGKIREVADPKLEGKFDEHEMFKVLLTASYCVRQSSIWRPSMTQVLELLTSGHGDDCEVSRSWRMPKFTSDELDDYSMFFGYDVPVDFHFEDFL